jgi:hypothetical protein
VEPVPDPLLLRKSGSAGNRTRISGSVARNPDHQTTEAVPIRDNSDKIRVGNSCDSHNEVCCIKEAKGRFENSLLEATPFSSRSTVAAGDRSVLSG